MPLPAKMRTATRSATRICRRGSTLIPRRKVPSRMTQFGSKYRHGHMFFKRKNHRSKRDFDNESELLWQ